MRGNVAQDKNLLSVYIFLLFSQQSYFHVMAFCLISLIVALFKNNCIESRQMKE